MPRKYSFPPMGSRRASARAVSPFFLTLRWVRPAVLGGAASLGLTAASQAGMISTVTEGPANAPYVYAVTLEFKNGDYYDYTLRSTQTTLSGLNLLNTVAALSSGSTTLTLNQVNSSFGYYLNGVTIGSDTNSGFANNSYWTYWNGTGNNPVQWTYAASGESDRLLTPGQSDGWVYGDGTNQPQATAFAVPEPGTWTWLGLGSAAWLAGRRGRQHGAAASSR